MTELSISKLVAGGDGLAFADGKAVFVPGVLPGERVRVRVTSRRRDFERAALVEVIEPSPHRAVPPCGLAGVCGGCDWLHISYEEQLRQKSAIASDALRRTGGIKLGEIPIEPSAPLGTRMRAQVHTDGAGGFGFMAARSDSVVKVATCPAATTEVNGLFAGTVRPPQGLDRFTVVEAGGALAVEGRDDLRDLSVRVCGREILFSVGCFFQSNLAALEALVPWALAGLQGNTAADLYAGVGLFGAFLAERFGRITCVESSAMSLSYARRNLPGTGHEFHPLSVESWIASGAGRAPFDAVVLDPPRAGLGPEVREWLLAAAPRAVTYVSCNPVTFARDLGALVRGGFVLEELRLFDFYPQTSHIEAAARLRPGEHLHAGA